jgi:hypothetical protein
MNIIKAIILGSCLASSLAVAAEDPRGKFVKVDSDLPNESLRITPLSCKYFVAQAVKITTMYMDGVDEMSRLSAIASEIAKDITNDDKYAGNALAVRFNTNIVDILAEDSVKKDIGYSYTYPQSVGRQMPKLCANMVGTKTDHIKRIFEKKS